MRRSEFEALVREGYGRLPLWVRKKIKNVAILVEDEPGKDIRKQEGLGNNETLLGLYHGTPLSARGEGYGVGTTLPDTITLYQNPIEEAALEEIGVYESTNFTNAVKKIVAETIWHEFAHHFGMDEEEVQKREKER